MADWRFRDEDWLDRFPPSKPIEAKGGIRAHSRRGGFGQSWWARRWISVLEGFHLGGRLQRGRSYARRGQVLSITMGTGSVAATVQGSRPEPYEVQIEVKPLSAAEWRKVAGVVSAQAIYAAKLLGGEMPQDIEAAFEAAGSSLFPQRYNDLRTHCSCPDWSNPCKHIAAVYYLIGEEFDRDPFTLFQLRGMTRDSFIELLGEPARMDAGVKQEIAKESLPVSPPAFWNGGELPEHPAGDAGAGAAGAAIVRRSGKFPFWRGREDLAEALDPVYREAAARAAQIIGEGAFPALSKMEVDFE